MICHRKCINILFLTFIISIFSSCSDEKESPIDEREGNIHTLTKLSQNEAQENILSREKELDAILIDCAYRAQNNKADNFLISPYQIYTIINGLSYGGDENTIKEISDVFHYDYSTYLENNNNLYSFYSPGSSNFTRDYIFQDYDVNIQNDFMSFLWKSHIHAHKVVSKQNPTLFANLVTDFVSSELYRNVKLYNTRFKEDTKVVAVNISQIQYLWRYKGDIVLERFSCANGDSPRVQMQRFIVNTFYKRNAVGGELVSVPMAKENARFNIYLPGENESIEDVLKRRKGDDLLENCNFINPGVDDILCDVTIPFLDMEEVIDNIQDGLPELGILSLVSPEGHLSQMDNSSLDRLTQLIQFSTTPESLGETKPYANDFVSSDSSPSKSEPIKIIANRPFLFSITCGKDNIVQLVGVINNL